MDNPHRDLPAQQQHGRRASDDKQFLFLTYYYAFADLQHISPRRQPGVQTPTARGPITATGLLG